MNRNTLRSLTLSSLLVLWATDAFTQPASSEIYRDSNGYFAVLPPHGWTRKDFPSETVRSKISFHHPTDPRISVLIIAGPTPRDPYTLDDVYAENKAKLDNPPPPLRGGNFELKRTKSSRYEGVTMTISKAGMIESEVVMFVAKNLWYSINFSAGTKEDFNRNARIGRKFIEDFIILDPKKKFTNAEIVQGLAASKKAMAELLEKTGNFGDALLYAQEGRALTPHDKDLEAIEKRLKQKQQRLGTVAGAGEGENATQQKATEWFEKGIKHYRSGEYDEAIKAFTSAIALNPNLAQAYNNRGNSYDKKAQYDKAIEDFNKAIALNPNDASTYLNRGKTSAGKAQYDKAIEDFGKAIALDQNLADAYYSRGLAYRKIDQYEKAIRDYDKAIALKPNDAYAYVNRGAAYLKVGSIDKAISDFRKACDLGNKNGCHNLQWLLENR